MTSEALMSRDLQEIKDRLAGLETQIKTFIDSSYKMQCKLVDNQNKLALALVALAAAVIGEKFLGSPPLESASLTLLLFGYFFAIGRCVQVRFRHWFWVTIALTGSVVITFNRALESFGITHAITEIDATVRIVAFICLVIFAVKISDQHPRNCEVPSLAQSHSPS